MKIKILKTTYPEIKDFNEKEWHGVDLEHYGKRVEWKDKKFIFKAVEDEKIVGTTSGRYESGVVYLGTIIVTKTKRGNGIGKLLIKRVESYAKKLGAHKIWLETGKGWKAENFYKNLEFKKVALFKNHHFHKDFIIYEKFI